MTAVALRGNAHLVRHPDETDEEYTSRLAEFDTGRLTENVKPEDLEKTFQDYIASQVMEENANWRPKGIHLSPEAKQLALRVAKLAGMAAAIVIVAMQVTTYRNDRAASVENGDVLLPNINPKPVVEPEVIANALSPTENQPKPEYFDADLVSVISDGIELNVGEDGLRLRSGPDIVNEDGRPYNDNIIDELPPGSYHLPINHGLFASKQNRHVPMFGFVVDEEIKQAFGYDLTEGSVVWIGAEAAGIYGNQDEMLKPPGGDDLTGLNNIQFSGDAEGERIRITSEGYKEFFGLAD
jgi:hypothetical protein